MKTSFKKAVEFSNVAAQYLKENPTDTKLKYAIEKVVKKLIDIQEEYNESRKDLEVDHANVDENKSLLSTTVDGVKQYSYTADGEKNLRKALNDLFKEERFEIAGHFVKELPEGFNEEYRPFFEGFVIEPKKEDTQSNE